MTKIKVWTKQHKSVLETLERTGRYTAKKEFIAMDIKEHANLVIEVYDWLVSHGPKASEKPADVEYPVWVSFAQEATMLPSDDFVSLELTIDPDIITSVNIAKWGAILNYSYIPVDEADAKRHQQLLKDYGTNDPKAYMTSFYPMIKREIVESWDRLFDDSVQLGNELKYGNIWEIRKEWITQVQR